MRFKAILAMELAVTVHTMVLRQGLWLVQALVTRQILVPDEHLKATGNG